MTEFQLNQIHKLGYDGEFIERMTISADTDDLSQLIDFVNKSINDAIRKENEKEIPGKPVLSFSYSVDGLLGKYNYKCITVNANWFQHTFTSKPLFSLKHHGVFLDEIITDD